MRGTITLSHTHKAKLRFARMLFVTLSAALTLAAHVASQEQSAMQATPFTLKALDGNEYSLQHLLDNKTTVIVFWATWGKDSGRVLGDMEELFQKYGGKGLAVVGVCVEQRTIDDSARKRINDSIRQQQITYPILLDNNLETFWSYRIVAVPTICIIDKNNRITYQLAGYPIVGRGELLRIITEAFEGPAFVVSRKTTAHEPNRGALVTYTMARREFARRKTAIAQSHAIKAVSQDSLFALPLALLSEISLEEGHLPEAEQLLKKAGQLDSTSIEIVRTRAFLLARQGVFEDATRILGRLLESDSSQAKVRAYLAYAIGMKGNLEAALRHFGFAQRQDSLSYVIP
ncbi:MAG: redoxin domain-containing protein, partial [Ignavibacteriae bacterium]|nr:redoxin domain-containing protein [Ignavibacteriota bacterium]